MRVVVVVIGLLAGACAVPQQAGSSMPSAYQAGNEAGCSSGFVAAGHPYYRFSKDPQRYQDDAMYRQGWDDGMVRCKGQYEAVGRALR